MRVHALHFTEPLDSGAFARLLQRVSPERRARIARYRFWQDAHRALYAELLARFTAQEALGRPLDSLDFAATDKGKPFLPGAPDFHFNLSHSGDWVLCATAAAPIGVDVERIQPLTPELLSEVLTPEEREGYEALPDAARPLFFFRIWTLKESYAKALGFGLQLRFLDLTVRETAGGIRILRHGELDPDVVIQTMLLDAEHPAALCVFPGAWTPGPLDLIRWQAEDFIQRLG